MWLLKGKKMCYMSHRCFLEPNHKYHFESHSFDGTPEFRYAPTRLSVIEVLKQQEVVANDFSGGSNVHGDELRLWKKKGIPFTLPYWDHLL